MLSYIITASINELTNLTPLNSIEQDVKVLIIDEGDAKLRMKNDEHLKDVPHEYFGPGERRNWFKGRFGSAYGKYEGVVPERCHAETSFGFLVAYEENADLVLELDDDVHIIKNFVRKHVETLATEESTTVCSEGKWYNTLGRLHVGGEWRRMCSEYGALASAPRSGRFDPALPQWTRRNMRHKKQRLQKRKGNCRKWNVLCSLQHEYLF